MNSKTYKSCAVPLCSNTWNKTPNKLFIYAPHDKIIRDKWMNLAGRDPSEIKLNSRAYFCEDHFEVSSQSILGSFMICKGNFFFLVAKRYGELHGIQIKGLCLKGPHAARLLSYKI